MLQNALCRRRAVWGARTMLLCGAIVLVHAIPGAAACPPSPRAACRLATSNVLLLFNDANDARDRFIWSWARGATTPQAEFGDPLGTTDYSLCVYDASGLIAGTDIAAGTQCGSTPCWRTLGTSGYLYRDAAAATAGVQILQMTGNTRPVARLTVVGRGSPLPDIPLPGQAPLTVQLSRSDSLICFESIFATTDLSRNDAMLLRARSIVKTTTPMAPLTSAGCGSPQVIYAPGTSTSTSLLHDGLSRTFRVYLPPTYPATNDVPVPIVILLHGGFGSGVQIETSSRLLEVADAEGFVVVSPDGVASPQGIRTWNAGGCCGYADSTGVDDVGFVAALLDQLEATLCVDRRRVYAAGMSNGAMLSHRLACDLADRIRAVGTVAGTNMADSCAPVRPVPVIHIHGTGDGNVPYEGGFGCGLAGVPFTSVPDTIAGWSQRDACSGRTAVTLTEGDGTCSAQGTCAAGADVTLCTIPNGGHQWPGGVPPAISGIGSCPFGYQSQTFSASGVVWDFFRQHPPH